MKFYAIAIAALTLAAFTGCTGSAGPQFKVQTPYGTYDGSTSGTVDLDLRPFFEDEMPPAKSYNEQLEK